MKNQVEEILLEKNGDAWCIHGDATVFDGIRRMHAHDVGTLIVVSKNRAVGMLSQRHILGRVIARGLDPTMIPVAEVMAPAQTIRVDASVDRAIDLVCATGAHHLLVVDGEMFAGVVSAKELMSWRLRDQALQINDLMGYITGRSAWYGRQKEQNPSGFDLSGLCFDEPPVLERHCVLCGIEDDDFNWDYGLALCRSCARKPGEAAAPAVSPTL